MSKYDTISETFCALPWLHLSSRPDGKMRTCCTLQTCLVQIPIPIKRSRGGEVGVVKNDDGIPHQRTTLEDAWNSSYMRNVPNDVTRRKTC